MRRLVVPLVALLLALPLAGCGKKGPLEPGEGKESTYPRTYPTR